MANPLGAAFNMSVNYPMTDAKSTVREAGSTKDSCPSAPAEERQRTSVLRLRGR